MWADIFEIQPRVRAVRIKYPSRPSFEKYWIVDKLYKLFPFYTRNIFPESDQTYLDTARRVERSAGPTLLPSFFISCPSSLPVNIASDHPPKIYLALDAARMQCCLQDFVETK